MKSSKISIQCLVPILTIFSISVTCSSLFIPRLSPLPPEFEPSSFKSDDEFQTFFYNQTLDHFNYNPESFSTFQQRYYMNFKFWGGGNGSWPIMVYFGAEDTLEGDLSSYTFLYNNAGWFKSLLVYIEHRYYGKSIPAGSLASVTSKGSNLLGYFNSAQAIADFAEIILYIKKQYRAEHSPVIVVGGSYGGLLASWFRLKYPHVALGALASSAPILYFDDLTPINKYFSVVTKDYRDVSETCYQTIRDSWAEIDKIASQPGGLEILSKKFKTCSPLGDLSELKNFLKEMYTLQAQYNSPPNYPVNRICGGIDGAPAGSDILDKILAGVVGLNGNKSCYINHLKVKLTEKFTSGWRWQTCSELLLPMIADNTTMFQPTSFDLNVTINYCKSLYGVTPRPHWITNYYGGYDIKLVLERFGSNIIFSNGLKDPYSVGGILENISDTIVAVKTENGSHCLDIVRTANPAADPDWLVQQRHTEAEIVRGWLNKYFRDLRALGLNCSRTN